jgi:hypothetical protein
MELSGDKYRAAIKIGQTSASPGERRPKRISSSARNNWVEINGKRLDTKTTYLANDRSHIMSPAKCNWSIALYISRSNITLYPKVDALRIINLFIHEEINQPSANAIREYVRIYSHGIPQILTSTANIQFVQKLIFRGKNSFTF